MAAIDVRCEPSTSGWVCAVTVVDDVGAPTTHAVTVSGADLARLAPGSADPVDLVTRSFDFLLAREPKESVLRRFDLMVIARYFPDFERAVGGYDPRDV